MKNKNQIDPLSLARRIRAAGSQIHIPEDDGDAQHIPSDSLRVYQTGGVIESTAFDWGGGTAYKIYIVITSRISGFAVSHFELELPWKQTSFYWLEDPVVIDGPSPHYRFCGNEILEFDRDSVINHRLDVTRPFSFGESVRGFLLGLGQDSIPEEFPHGKMIPAFLVLYDQFTGAYRAPVELWTDRMRKKRLGKPLGVPRKGGLLDKPDTIVRD